MLDLLFESAVGATAFAASGATALWQYNRDNYFLDRQLKQNRDHQIQNLRISKAGLFREDIRDIFGLTVQKMDQYLVVNTLQIGFTISLFYDARLPEGIEPWLYLFFTFTCCVAIMFLLLSIWLSIHASLTAQSFVVRLLTTTMRLPIPSDDKLTEVMGRATMYERDFAKQLQIPSYFKSEDPKENKLALETPEEKPIDVYKDLKMTWQGWDAYARVSMTVGTLSLLQGLSVFSVSHFTAVVYQPFAAWACCSGFGALTILIVRIDFLLSRAERIWTSLFALIPAFLGLLATTINQIGEFRDVPRFLAPFVFLTQTIWYTWLLKLSTPVLGLKPNAGLPTRYRSVVNNNIFDKHVEIAKTRARMLQKLKDEENPNFYALSENDMKNTEPKLLFSNLSTYLFFYLDHLSETLQKWVCLKEAKVLREKDSTQVKLWVEEYIKMKKICDAFPTSSKLLRRTRNWDEVDPYVWTKTNESPGSPVYVHCFSLQTSDEVRLPVSFRAKIFETREELDDLRTMQGFHARLELTKERLNLIADIYLLCLGHETTEEQITRMKEDCIEKFVESCKNNEIHYTYLSAEDNEHDDWVDIVETNRQQMPTNMKMSGSLPWKVFLYASLVSIVIFFLGFIWAGISIATKYSIINFETGSLGRRLESLQNLPFFEATGFLTSNGVSVIHDEYAIVFSSTGLMPNHEIRRKCLIGNSQIANLFFHSGVLNIFLKDGRLANCEGKEPRNLEKKFEKLFRVRSGYLAQLEENLVLLTDDFLVLRKIAVGKNLAEVRISANENILLIKDKNEVWIFDLETGKKEIKTLRTSLVYFESTLVSFRNPGVELV